MPRWPGWEFWPSSPSTATPYVISPRLSFASRLQAHTWTRQLMSSISNMLNFVTRMSDRHLKLTMGKTNLFVLQDSPDLEKGRGRERWRGRGREEKPSSSCSDETSWGHPCLFSAHPLFHPLSTPRLLDLEAYTDIFYLYHLNHHTPSSTLASPCTGLLTRSLLGPLLPSFVTKWL